MAKGIYNISEGNFMAAHKKIVYIYIEGFDLPQRGIAQRKKHEAKNREFIAVQYKQDGSFEPELPFVDADTKVILDGHSYALSDNLTHREGGIKLSYQTIADELAKKMAVGEDRVQIALYGCETGMGERKDLHSESLAGKLFRALVEKGLKPTISANLLLVSIDTTGRLKRTIKIKKEHRLSETYHRFAAEIYEDALEALKENPERFAILQAYQKDLENFSIIQMHRERILDYKAQGSTVKLSYSADTPLQPDIQYPFGHPNIPLDLEALTPDNGSGTSVIGKAGLQLLLRYEILFAQNLKEKMEKAREELREIFENFESTHPNLWDKDPQKEEQYNLVKEFLLTEDYYVDAVVISQFIAAFALTKEEGSEALTSEIRKSEILKGLKFHAEDCQFNTELYYDLDLGYLQLGLAIVKNKINDYPSRISSEAFARLGKDTQEQLAIELGKQLACHQFDNEWVQQCIGIAQDPNGDCKMVARDSFDTLPLELRIVLELGKKQQGVDYDAQFIQFIQDHSLLVPKQLAIVGEFFIEAGYYKNISLQGFNLLSKDQQEDLSLFLGRQLLNYSFSDEDQCEMNDIIEIADNLLLKEQHQKTAVSQSIKGIAANSHTFLAAPSLHKGKDQKPEENPQQQWASCTIS